MARSDRFLIAPLTSGQQTDLRPWLIPDDAFERLTNAYVFRGRVVKRFGERYLDPTTAPDAGFESLPSRLRIQLGTTSGAGALSGTVPGSTFEVGQMFSVGNDIYTVQATGTMATTSATGVGTYNITTGAYSFTTAGATTAVYFYPSQPVMGFVNFENTAINLEPTYAFDTQFSYEFTTAGWTRLGTAVWTGTNSEFFWGTNWQGVTSDETYLFVTNYNATDRIKYYSSTTGDWTANTAGTQIGYSPVVNNLNRMLTARILVPFKDRLVALNTIENNEGTQVATTAATTGNLAATVIAGTMALGQSFVVNNTIFTIASTAAGAQPMTVRTITGLSTPPTATFNFATKTLTITGNNNNPSSAVYYLPNSGGTQETYKNRCRFTWNGSPISANTSGGAATEPNATAAWLEAPGLGGYIDAPTREAIVTAQFLYDRLIVYFESSTWELVYTGNQLLPFVWQKINTELGAESTFSQVPFDKIVLGVGNVGIHACNGSNVDRVDQKIPDEVFNLHNADSGLERVAGIRDYARELVYWTFPSETRDSTYPYNDKVLVYNYKTGSWAFNNDSITALGYYQAQTDASQQWDELDMTWEQANFAWSSGSFQSGYLNIVAGNQQGFTFIISGDLDSNIGALQVTDITINGLFVTVTCYNHNLTETTTNNDYVMIVNSQGISNLNSVIGSVYSVVDADTFIIELKNVTVPSGTYTGGGVVQRVSNINILTKQYNFYTKNGMNTALNKVDCLVDRTSGGEITIDYYASSSNVSTIDAGNINGSLVGTGAMSTAAYTLNPFEENQTRIWHPVYPMVNGECIQLRFYMNDVQMRTNIMAFDSFVLHAMMLYTNPTGSRLQ